MRADSNTVRRQLKTARGQLDGIIKMVEEDRYCVDISNQLLATKAIINKVNAIVIAGHLEGCLIDAFNSNDEQEKEIKMQELRDLLQKAISK